MLKNKVAIITGAASGMGRATAVKFAQNGARVVVADINDTEGNQTVELVKQAGGDGVFVHTDVSSAKETQALADAALKKWGTIDILHNNAAATVLCNTKDRPVHELEEWVWDKMHAISLKSVYLCSKAVLPTMMKNKFGSIINMTSMDAIVSEPGFDAYTAAKGGVISLTRCMAGEYGPYNIRVNVISPGYIVTECQMPWVATQPRMVASASSMHALQRLGKPEEVADAVLFLASDMSTFVTGAIIPVDGGFTIFKQTNADALCRVETPGVKITDLEVFVIGDAGGGDPNDSRIEPLPFVRIHTDAGISGLSEAFRVPPGVARAAMGGRDSYFGPLLIGQEITHPERLWTRLYEAMTHANRRGWGVMCIGALDVAIWDLYGKSLGRPVFELLGGPERSVYQTPDGSTPKVTPYCTIISKKWNCAAMVDEQVSISVRLKELGFKAVKVEPLMSEPKWIIETARQARQALGQNMTLCVDVGYFFNDVAAALRVARAIEPFNIYFLETPFPVDSPRAYAGLAAQTPIPLAMGEHAVTRWEFLNMVEHGGLRVAQPYMTTCGGLTEAKRIVDLMKPLGVTVCPGNWSSQALGTATVHLAAYSSITPFIEYAPAQVLDSPLRAELQSLGLPVVNGTIALPINPGIGYDVPDELIGRYRIA